MRKKEKGGLDLSEIKNKGTKRKSWGDSIGSNIYYEINGMYYTFKLIGYNKDKQELTILFGDKFYNICTSSVLSCRFGNIIGTCVKDFRYEVGEVIKTKRKKCLILDRFRNKKGKKAYMCKCIDCGNVKSTDEDHMENRGFVCNVCSDKISYPERFVGSFLSQLGVKYEYQKKFDWSRSVSCNNRALETDKIYDYYIPEINSIIEVHGEIHYKNNRWSKCRPMNEMIENDNLKMKIALENGINNYIILDCKESDSEYIKNSIMNSNLVKLFNLSEINWRKCDLDSCTSLMKICSDLWNEGLRPTRKIAEKLGISKATVITYLKKFSKLGLNDYNPKEELKSSWGKVPVNAKEVIMLKDDKVLGIFKSATDLARKSLEEYSIQLNQTDISMVARGERNSYKGYQFKYVENLTEEEKIKYNIKD